MREPGPVYAWVTHKSGYRLCVEGVPFMRDSFGQGYCLCVDNMRGVPFMRDANRRQSNRY